VIHHRQPIVVQTLTVSFFQRTENYSKEEKEEEEQQEKEKEADRTSYHPRFRALCQQDLSCGRVFRL